MGCECFPEICLRYTLFDKHYKRQTQIHIQIQILDCHKPTGNNRKHTFNTIRMLKKTHQLNINQISSDISWYTYTIIWNIETLSERYNIFVGYIVLRCNPVCLCRHSTLHNATYTRKTQCLYLWYCSEKLNANITLRPGDAHMRRWTGSVLLHVMGLLPDTQNCGLRMRRECRERFPKPPLVSDSDMHHGTCVTHVP